MKLSKFKNMAMIGAMSIAGVGLVGVGAHATFSTATTSSQQITTGTPGVALTAPGATLTGVGSDCTNTGEACGNITLAPVGPTGSSFTSGDQLITISNIGNIPLTELVFTVSSTYPTSALAHWDTWQPLRVVQRSDLDTSRRWMGPTGRHPYDCCESRQLSNGGSDGQLHIRCVRRTRCNGSLRRSKPLSSDRAEP
jgi:hypothetical protein